MRQTETDRDRQRQTDRQTETDRDWSVNVRASFVRSIKVSLAQ